MADNKQELGERIKNGIEYFKKIPLPSQWTSKDMQNLQVLHKLMQEYIEGASVFFNDLNEEPRGFK